MKNIHVLPTDKPSRLYLTTKEYIFEKKYSLSTDECQNKHIYITNSEEIKEGDYVVQINFEKTNTQVIKCETEFQTKIANSKDGSFSKNKIILTTDQALIKDGVQDIDDEFLEWFVKNPSCEWVEVEKGYLGMGGFCKSNEIISKDKIHYKIIIPKEEQKKHLIDMMKEDEELGLYNVFNDEKRQGVKELIDAHKQETPKTFKELFANTGIEPTTDENGNTHYNFKATMKQETLEEAAERLQKDKYGIFISKDADVKGQLVIDTAKAAFLSGMKEGAKWQQEQDKKCYKKIV